MNLDLVPKSCKLAVVWRIRVPKLNLDCVPKNHAKTFKN